MKEDQIKMAVAAVAGTEAGVLFFREMARTCGFHLGDLIVSPVNGLVDPVATAINVERRRVYLHFRAMIPSESLIKIEFGTPSEAVQKVTKEEK